MDYPNIILWGNNIFIKIDSNQTFVKEATAKYHRGSISGLIFDGIFTYPEIMSKCAVGFTTYNSFRDIK